MERGVGTLYIGLQSSVDCFDGVSKFTQVIAGADLSQLGNEVPFSLEVPISEADAGDWVLQAFLDDDDDAVFEIPDEGDMTQSPAGFEDDGGAPSFPHSSVTSMGSSSPSITSLGERTCGDRRSRSWTFEVSNSQRPR